MISLGFRPISHIQTGFAGRDKVCRSFCLWV